MRFFFHVHDGASIRDEDGHELPSIEAAKIESVRIASDMLREHAQEFWSGEEWQLEVTDEAGLTLFTLMFTAAVSPSMTKLEERASRTMPSDLERG